ncbi:MAG: hypothetical protein AB7P69_16015, partial [Candidatus Binatia bacterium]
MRTQAARYPRRFFLTWSFVIFLVGGQIAFAQSGEGDVRVAFPIDALKNSLDSVMSILQTEGCDPATPLRDAGRLCANEVRTVIENTAKALDLPMTVAVVDRVGNILGVFRKLNAPLTAPGNFLRENVFVQGQEQDAVEVAVSLARTAAFFSNNQAPLSSRTVRFISGVHFPPGVRFTPNAALYGIENTNRGCDFNATFNLGKEVPRAKSFQSVISLDDLACTN